MKIVITKQHLEEALRRIKSNLDILSSSIETISTDAMTQDDVSQYLLDSINGLKPGTEEGTFDIDLSDADNSTSQFITIDDVKDAIDNPDSEIGQVIDGLESDIDSINDKLVGIDGTVSEEIASAIASLHTLKMEIVDELPSIEDADSNTFYLILNESNGYDIYAKINDELVQIDDTDVSIEGYVKTITTDITSESFTPDSSNNVELEIGASIESLISERLGANISTTVENWVSDNFVQQEQGKSLISDSDIQKLETISNNAEENIIENVQVNGTNLPVTDKTINVEVPTNISDLNNDSDFVQSSEIGQAISDYFDEIGGVSVDDISGVLPLSKGGTGANLQANEGYIAVGDATNNSLKLVSPSNFADSIGVAKKSLYTTVNITPESWVSKSQSKSSTSESYYTDIPLNGCTQGYFPYVSIDSNIIGTYGIDSRCESMENAVRIYSKSLPTDTITNVSVLAVYAYEYVNLQ